jgi:transposase
MKRTRKSEKACAEEKLTVGIDIGDKYSHYCVLDESGDVVEEGRIRTTPAAFTAHFEDRKASRIAIETGTHSAWINELLLTFSHEVLVASTRDIPSISASDNKSDPNDAEKLARFARFDPKLLHPIQHRNLEMQADLTVIRARAKLVEVRTTLINTVRSIVKGFGHRVPKCVADSFHNRGKEAMPACVSQTLQPILGLIERVNKEITAYDSSIEELCRSKYPQTSTLRTIPGVGPIASLTFVLTIADENRFLRSRDVGAYLGLRPKRSQSGDRDPQLRITKAGDTYLRKVLIQCSHYILGPHGADSALKRWGTGLAARGGPSAKRRAIVAVARKLAVLLHRLWVTGRQYRPFPESAVAVAIGA